MFVNSVRVVWPRDVKDDTRRDHPSLLLLERLYGGDAS